jgi:hypothetical protein
MSPTARHAALLGSALCLVLAGMASAVQLDETPRDTEFPAPSAEPPALAAGRPAAHEPAAREPVRAAADRRATVQLFGPPRALALARELLGTSNLELVNASCGEAMAATRANRAALALVGELGCTAHDLAERPWLTRAVAIVARGPGPTTITARELRTMARHGSLRIDPAAAEILLLGNPGALPLGAARDDSTARRGRVAFELLPLPRATGASVLPLDGVAPTTTAVRNRSYRLGFDLRILHRFDADAAVARTIDRLLGADVARRLVELWPE